VTQPVSFTLASEAEAVRHELEALVAAEAGPRIGAGDPTLWSDDHATQAGIRNRLGWVTVAGDGDYATVDPAAGGVLLLGMGGSSLGAAALASAFGARDRLRVLDCTLPAAVRAAGRVSSVSDIVVASKSGSTIETDALARFFEDSWPERRFHAITDQGSALERRAAEFSYAACHLNRADIGGRFSVLSNFGLVPAQLAGIAVEPLLEEARAMARRCAAVDDSNPGLRLGAALAAAARSGKVLTLVAQPGLEDFAAWIEQLVAESTGKAGVGLVPVLGEDAGARERFPDRRLYVSLAWSAGEEPADIPDGAAVIRFVIEEPAALGAELYRWQFAVAAAGARLGVNPFDEPDVAAAKQQTSRMLTALEAEGAFPEEEPLWRHEALNWFADGAAATPRDFVRAISPGDYLAVLAYLPETPALVAAVGRLRAALGESAPVALGWGPRYLHSSGQLHKGGPPTGRFVILTADDAADLAVPGQPWTFGSLARAQALGDYRALRARGLAAARLHLGGETETALAAAVRIWN
jgi:hypothetical protein